MTRREQQRPAWYDWDPGDWFLILLGLGFVAGIVLSARGAPGIVVVPSGPTATPEPVHEVTPAAQVSPVVVPSPFALWLDGGSGAGVLRFLSSAGSFSRGSAAYETTGGVLISRVAGYARVNCGTANGPAQGVCVEPQHTNYLLRSEEFDDAYWTKNNLSAGTNAAVAPDGATTAESVTQAAGWAIHRVFRAVAGLPTGGHRTLAAFVKAGAITAAALELKQSSAPSAVLGAAHFNLSAGTVTATSGTTFSAATIEPWGGGWYRVAVVAATDSRTVLDIAICFPDDGGTDCIYTGADALDGYLWGAALTISSAPTSYITTTSAAATRSADVVSFATAGRIDARRGTLALTFTPAFTGTDLDATATPAAQTRPLFFADADFRLDYQNLDGAESFVFTAGGQTCTVNRDVTRDTAYDVSVTWRNGYPLTCDVDGTADVSAGNYATAALDATGYIGTDATDYAIGVLANVRLTTR